MTDSSTLSQPVTLEEQSSRRVSFILVTKDHAAYIGAALELSRQLVGPEDELIVVDGASTDGTTEVITRYGDLVDVFISEPDDNPTHALNKGILVARGRYIKQITDDDTIYPEAMEQAIDVLDRNPSIDLLVCGGTRELNGVVTPVYVPPGANYGQRPEDLFRHPFCGVGLVWRRRAIPHMGLLNNFGGATDGEFVLQAIQRRAEVKFCRINLFHHTLYSHSYILHRQREWERDLNRLVKQYCSRRFYLKYRVKLAVLRSPLLGQAALWCRNALLPSRRGGGGKSSPATPGGQPVWDGGFS